MLPRGLIGIVALLGLGSLACGSGAPKAPTRAAVLELLKQEAEGMKRDGEKMDPALGVSARWEIESVDVSERPNDKDKPWGGTIRFKIEAKTKDVGASHTDTFEKAFQYTFDAASGRWGVSVEGAQPPRRP